MERGEYESMDLLERDHWWFQAKRRFLRLALRREILSLGVSHTALDVGCGTGAVLQELQAVGFTTQGLDMSPIAKGFCEQKKLNVTLGEATALPFSDASFDVVTALDVVEHVDDDRKAMKELYRVVKPGGVIVITVPAHPYLWSYHDVALHHKRRYTKAQLRSLVDTVQPEGSIGWIHATILPGVFLVRILTKFIFKEKKTSDVKPASPMVTAIMRLPYVVEDFLFRLFGSLPWGVSLIAIIRRPV